MDEETSALFGVRRGVLRRMKLLKQKIEEIEEKERNIENLVNAFYIKQIILISNKVFLNNFVQ